MEKYTLILIVVMNFFLVFILVLLVFIIYRIYKQNLSERNMQQVPELPKHQKNTDYHPEVLERIRSANQFHTKRSDLFCPNHLEEPGEATCAICDHLFCKSCIRPYKALHFCKEHIPLIMRHEWAEILTLKTSTEDPEEGVKLYAIKKNLFREENIPTYIETHYKINIDQDFIETYLVLYSIKEEAHGIKEKLSNYSF